jgi:hypothetical protein
MPPYAANEAQTFSLQSPGLFFNIYSPPRNEAAFKSARSKLEEELRFVSKTVRIQIQVFGFGFVTLIICR